MITAGEHVIEWFDLEEEAYASREKFGYERNLKFLRESGVEPNSVWRDSQFTSYWSRAVLLDRQLRADSADLIGARQIFAKHANSVRALLSTLLTQQNGGDYEKGKDVTREKLRTFLTDAEPLFTDSASFNALEHWDQKLEPMIDATQAAVRGNLPPEMKWDEVVATTIESERHEAAIEPVGSLLISSFQVVTSFVYCDGPLPEPGVPSGTVRLWNQAQ